MTADNDNDIVANECEVIFSGYIYLFDVHRNLIIIPILHMRKFMHKED
jgi:hypothetical protein